MQVVHAWLVNEDARDWLDPDRTLDGLARTPGSKYPGGDLTVHHIFPRKVLTEAGIPEHANRPANFALLSRSTNAELGDRAPDEILRVLTPEQRKYARLQCFSEEAGDRLRRDQYEQFCEWRAKCLAEALNDFLGID